MHRFDYKVSLRICHPTKDPDEICATLGLKPSFAWKVGAQRITPKGTKLNGYYKNTYCSFELLHSEEEGLADFLKKSINSLEPFKEYFSQIDASGGEIEFFIGWFSDENSGEVFDLELLNSLVRLRIKLSLDFYGCKPDLDS